MDMIKYKLSYEIYKYIFGDIIAREIKVCLESVCLSGKGAPSPKLFEGINSILMVETWEGRCNMSTWGVPG